MDEQTIETYAMRLANRAYLYRLFHIVFGAEPSSEELHTLASTDATEAVSYIRDACRGIDVNVAAGCGSDSREIPAAEALADAVDLLRTLSDAADDEDAVAAMHAEYSRLFVAPGKSYVHPWESPYIGKEVMLFQESTLDVRHRYAAHGFVAVEFGHFPEDHISMMLDFLAHLSGRAFTAFEEGRDEEVCLILESQADFVSAHMLNWLPSFHEELCAKDAEGVYRRFAEALAAFLTADRLFAAEFAKACETEA